MHNILEKVKDLLAEDERLVSEGKLLINFHNPQNSYPRSKLRCITEFCPFGYGFWKSDEPSHQDAGYSRRE